MLSKNQIKEIQSLQVKKFRDLKKLFIAEGVKTVTEILDQAPILIQEILATQEFISQNKVMLRRLNIKFTEVTPAELKLISLQSTPNHTFAICSYFKETKDAFDFDSGFSFYLDDLRDPGNLGTIIRLADWFGINTIYCSPTSCDFYNPKVIQSTMGAFLRVKIIYKELEDLITELKIKTVYGAVLNGKNLYRERLKSGLIVIGNEANGISAFNLSKVNEPLTIPANQSNGTESLNAAIATSMIASEFFRQLKFND